MTDLVVPIPIKPKPAQIITLNAIHEMDKENQTEEDPVLQARSKSAIPSKTTNSGMTSVTMTLGNNSSKSVLKVLNGLTKLLQIDAPKHWQIEDKSGNMRDMFRCKIENGVDPEPMETSMDLQTILTSGARLCKQCDTVIQAHMVKKKTSELTFLTKQEREEASDELYFCNANCYFEFVIKRTDQEETKDVKNLAELEELQAKQRAVKKEVDDKKAEGKEDDTPKHKGTFLDVDFELDNYRTYFLKCNLVHEII